MKFYLIFACLLLINVLHAQEEEEYTYYDEVFNKNIIEGGLSYFIPQSDFGRKSANNGLGGEFSYLRQINYSRIFLGFSYSSRKLDSYTLLDFAPDLDLQTKVVNNNFTFLGRIYPQVYFSIFELFGEAGVGLNSIKAFSRDYDRIDGAYYNQFTNNVDRKIYFYGGGGLHITLDESWFLTTKAYTAYGPTIAFFSKKDNLTNIEFSEDAFELKEATYRATSISLSLSFIF
ncbi:hypothetical protein [Portibacter lacus]|uniref:Outer membrane protein beta-barrel domain-containing protein n=1 Tax=Portibacter lacus TaxID=1099794 RepID=A0AA37STW2_9BACT|nr:hypothetical protein [Portibacter lacus]GLR20167.1 hypothetical protein GCM10007940_47830 [Portibacter lacus]